MAGRVPRGADRAAVKGEMETVFVENLRHAAGVLAQVRGGSIPSVLGREDVQRGTDEVTTQWQTGTDVGRSP